LLKTRNDYWSISRIPALGLFFAAPLWLLYEVFAYQLNDGLQGNLRTGIDLLIKLICQKLGVPLVLCAILPFIIILVVFYIDSARLRAGLRRPVYFAYMLLESIVYAAFFGLIVGGVTTVFMSLRNVAQYDTRLTERLILNIGSGFYEELVFRFGLLSLLLLICNRLLKNKTTITYSVSIIISAIIFAMFHHIKIFSEPFAAGKFIFRFFAGIAFAILYLTRGLGITIYTHSMYNIFLMFREDTISV
jgi:hypothetical protein